MQEQVGQSEPKSKKRYSKVDVQAFNMRLQGMALAEIAARQGVAESTACRRAAKVESRVGRDVLIEDLRDTLFSFSGEAAAAVLTGLRQVEPSIVNAYFKGLGVYVDKASLEVAPLSPEEIERRRLAGQSRGMALFGLSPIDVGKVDSAVSAGVALEDGGGATAQGGQGGGAVDGTLPAGTAGVLGGYAPLENSDSQEDSNA